MVTDSSPPLDYLLDTQPAAGPTHYAQVLREQRHFRIEQLRELDGTQQPDTDQLAEVTAALRQAAVTALAEIDAALDRLGNGSYGTCVRCRGEIMPERLEILPAVALCMSCQHVAEVMTD